MEQVYALGVTVIEFIQYWFQDWATYLEWVNDISNPYWLLEFAFPLVSIVDSVFAAQLLLVLGFGGWLNTVMKWWLLEDRPYWWVQETTFYTGERPRLKQTRQTCETGPGCPSGHSAAGAAALVLILMFVSHVMRDRKFYIRNWKYFMYPVCGGVMISIVLARMFVAAHFPHQCLFGTIIGAFIGPALCLYVSDPCIWQLHPQTADPSSTVAWHVASVVAAAGISAVTYAGLELAGIDPQWTVEKAYRWCEHPGDIQFTTTPLFSLTQCIASLLGWALTVTPTVAKYRHYTKDRSLIISSASTGLIMFGMQQVKASIEKDHSFKYYAIHFVLNAVKPPLFLRLTPALAMWPFEKAKVH